LQLRVLMVSLVHQMHFKVLTKQRIFKQATVKEIFNHCRIAEADPQQWEG
jgi:hypothetical protein